jgi:hypothetical protein
MCILYIDQQLGTLLLLSGLAKPAAAADELLKTGQFSRPAKMRAHLPITHFFMFKFEIYYVNLSTGHPVFMGPNSLSLTHQQFQE